MGIFREWERGSGNFEMLVNPRFAKQSRELAVTITNGIPEAWVPYQPWNRDPDIDIDAIYIDSAKTPRYVGKTRQHVSWINNPAPGADMRALNAFADVRVEMELSNDLADILQSSQATALAGRYGFTGLRFIEPIVSMIDRRDRSRQLSFYPYVEGEVSLRTERTGWFFATDILLQERLRDDLYTFFRSQGIEPYDFGLQSVILPRKSDPHHGLMYIVDAEGFYRR